MKNLHFYNSCRKDLANIVRRRGYKVIAELLKNSTTKDDNTKLASAENHVSGDSSKDEISGQNLSQPFIFSIK